MGIRQSVNSEDATLSALTDMARIADLEREMTVLQEEGENAPENSSDTASQSPGK